MLAAVRDHCVSDSLTADPQPPPDEAPAAREAHLASEREPKNVSDGIDEQVRQEKEARNATLKEDWKIYDVGGAQNQRQAWAPYFEHMNALIFVGPISAFDQVLAKDPRVNCVEDSLLLWRCVVANKLLSNVNIILFLNECDLLKGKLEAGVQLNQDMSSYGDGPNDHEAVSKYFRNKFLALNQLYSSNPDREVYVHLTPVTDTRRTSSILSNLRDIILRDDLKGVKLL